MITVPPPGLGRTSVPCRAPGRPGLRHRTPARRGVGTRGQPGGAGRGAGVAALSDPAEPAEGSGNLDGPEVAASAMPAPAVTAATAVPASSSGRPRQRKKVRVRVRPPDTPSGMAGDLLPAARLLQAATRTWVPAEPKLR